MSTIPGSTIKDSGFTKPKPSKPKMDKSLTWGAGSKSDPKLKNIKQSPTDSVSPELRAAIRGGGGRVETDSATPRTGGGRVGADRIDSVISGLVSSFAQ